MSESGPATSWTHLHHLRPVWHARRPVSGGFRRVFVFVLFLAACGSTPERPPEHAAAPPPPPPPPVTEAPPEPPPPKPTSTVKGLTGTLNLDDVHQTMDERQNAFDACIEMSRRSLRRVSGAIRFAFKVGADGTVEEVHTTESNIGHRALEECLSAAVGSR